MGSTLVVYFSRTGHTRKIALEIAAALGADIERIEEPRSRSGFFGYWRSGREAYRKQTTTIQAAQKQPSSYELVILGTPIWAGNMSSPIRTYVMENAGAFKRMAFFCTHGGTSGPKVLAGLAELCAVQPIATLAVTEREIATGAYADGVRRFVERLRLPSAA
jgi:flavodoxin